MIENINSIAYESMSAEVRQCLQLVVIGTATALALGLTLTLPARQGQNDTSRWCTVWSLLERGTYAIDDCPWKTIDKVWGPTHNALRPPGRAPAQHFYSSKPPLLATLVAGLIYPWRAALKIPLDRPVLQGRFLMSEFYFKPVIVLLNIVPFCLFLVLYARLLDRFAVSDWSWIVSLFAAALGTQLFTFNVTLNNHTIAAYSGFFALYSWLRIWYDGAQGFLLFMSAGFFSAFCACNELPAALFGIMLFGMLMIRAPWQTLLGFVPAAAIPCSAYLLTQYLALGTIVPLPTESGTKYTDFYEGSCWITPEGLDAKPEPKPVYLFHMLLGGHGVFSLTPILLFPVMAIAQNLIGKQYGLTGLAWLTTVLTVTTVALYTWRTSNYGGLTQGMRWLFWLFPFWLVFLPQALDLGVEHAWFRTLSLTALLVSIFSVGFGAHKPWSSPWIRLVFRGMSALR
jgi:hypothetical protein